MAAPPTTTQKLLAEALGTAFLVFVGTFMLVFVIFGVIDHRAVPGWAPMAIGAVVFAIIIIVGPATGAAINPARYLGAVFMQDGVRRHVSCGRRCPPTSSASSSAACSAASPGSASAGCARTPR